MKLPFKLHYSSWGLRGTAYDEAEAYYELDGQALEERLAQINMRGSELKKELARIRHQHNAITEHEWMRVNIESDIPEGVDREVELLKLDIEFKRIERQDGEKQIAALLDEPWVSIVEEGLDPALGANGFYFVFDWNEQWIDVLRKSGYEGGDDDMMEKWFSDVCREQVLSSQPVPFNSSIVYD